MNPLLTRHLYGSVRRNRFFWLLSAYLLGLGLLTLLFSGLIFSDIWGNGQGYRLSMFTLFTQGRVLYWFSSVLLLFTALLLAPLNALGALAGEREQRTLDLLRLTTLRSRDIVLGKLGAALTTGALYILAPLPLLMFGYWLGGVGVTELLLTLLLFVVTMFSSTAWALFLSTIARRTIAAVLIFYGTHLALIPLLASAAGLLATLLSAWQSNMAIEPQAFWLEALLQYGWVLLTALHPLSAAIAAETLWLDQGSWFFLRFEVGRYILDRGPITLGMLTLPSPWLPHILLMLLQALFWLWLTMRQLAKPER